MYVVTRFISLTSGARRAIGGAALAAAGAAALVVAGPSAPSVHAAPDPCAASQVARTVGSVATNTGVYLDAHPAANQALTTISQQPAGPQSLAMLKAYFDANPEVAADLQTLQQPLATLSGRCKLPVTVPQLLGLMQTLQQNQGAAGQRGSAQTVGADTSPAPAQRPSASVPGSGPLPGPASVS